MADGFETIGWILSVEDRATKQVEKITKFMDRNFLTMASDVKDLSDVISDWGAESGPVAKGVDALGSSFVDVLGGGAVGAAEAANTVAKTMQDACETQAECAKDVNKKVKETRFGLRGAAVEAGGLAKSFLTMGGVFEKMGGMGGIAGVLLGPLAPLMSLFKPLLNMIVKLMMPALETFSAIVETAFAPLAMTMEIIARNLATKIVPLLAPFVSMLEMVAVQLGGKIMKALEGIGDVSGPMMGLFSNLLPVIMTLVDAFTKLAAKLLPVAVKLFEMLAPIAVEFVTMLAETLVPIVEMFGEIVGELGPPLVKMIGQLLKAVMPLIPPLLDLYMVLYTQIFGPVLVKAIEGIIMLVTALLPPFVKLVNWLIPKLIDMSIFIEEFADAFADAFEKVGVWLEHFITAVFVGFSPSLKDVFEFIPNQVERVADSLERMAVVFKQLLFETIPRIWSGFWTWAAKTFKTAQEWVGKIWGTIVETLGLDSAGTRLRGIVGSILAAIKVPLMAIANFINDNVIRPANAILAYDPPGPFGKLSEIIGLGENYQIADIGLAKGGIVKEKEGGTTAQIGEGGADELVLPLRADTVERVLAPLIPNIEFPALAQLADTALRIERFLNTGILRVQPVGGGGLQQARSNDRDNLGDAVGMEGMAF